MSTWISTSIDSVTVITVGQAVLELEIRKPDNVMVGKHLTTDTVLLSANWQTPTITSAMEKHSNAMSINSYIIPQIPALAFF